MRWVVLAAALGACGSDSKKADAPQGDGPVKLDAPKPDAKPADAPIDAPQHVFKVTCPNVPNATFTTSSFMFVPTSATITVGQIVEISEEPIHSVAPGHVPADTAIADPGLSAGFGQTTCFQFMQAGTYGFHCSAHTSMNGTITVN